VRVTLDDPVQVAEGVGHCWFPQITRFPTGELMAYDRTPFGWRPVPADSPERSRAFVLPITVERT
jgi:hypothetical protein